MQKHAYHEDPHGQACLALAAQGKARTSFGALLVRDGKTIAQGRNRRSVPGENERLGGGVDYAIHAEQATILDALDRGLDVSGAELYVLGQVNAGPDRGKLSVRARERDHAFSCVRCARTLAHYNVSVRIPLPSGWHTLSPAQALAGAERFRAAKRARVFSVAA
jgi:hypothetical protein